MNPSFFADLVHILLLPEPINKSPEMKDHIGKVILLRTDNEIPVLHIDLCLMLPILLALEDNSIL